MREHFRPITALCLALTALVAACDFEHRSSPTAPSDIIRSFVGSWTSTTASPLPSPDACGNVEWHITDVNGTTVSGDFRATCAGGIVLAGTGTGTLDGEVLRWTANGTASGSSGPSCPFSLSGTAVREGDGLRVNYSGTTCFGPISGNEFLKKK